MFYQVTGHVHMELDNGATTTVQLPTFFLDSNVQGIVDADHAKRIAATMIQSVMTVPSAVFMHAIAMSSGDNTDPVMTVEIALPDGSVSHWALPEADDRTVDRLTDAVEAIIGRPDTINL